MEYLVIENLFDKWNNALKSGIPQKVLALYDQKAILLPTISDRVRHNHPEIKEYFEAFLLKKPSGKVNESNIRLFGDIAINSGVYTFTFGDRSSLTARFTFVYRKANQKWLIVEHHSSIMPEQLT